MAKALAGSLTVNLAMTHTNSAVGGVVGRNVIDPVQQQKVFAIAHGTGAGKADLPYQVEFTIAGNGNSIIDLNGVLTDTFGAVLADAAIKLMVIENTSVSPNTAAHVFIGPHTSAGLVGGPWKGISGTNDQPGTEVPVGGMNVFARGDAAGWVVTATTGDKIQLVNQHATQTAKIKMTIIAASA